MKSIIQEKKECFFCGRTDDLHLHHICEGRNRGNSDKYGLTIYLCPYHHNMGDDSVHFNHIYDKLMKIIGQLYFERTYNEEFIDVFRKNYRED